MGEENNQLYYYHGDHLGSAQIVTDPEGEIYEQLEYTPYGELWVEHLKTTIEAMPFRFTGKERDRETGLYYFRARYLNPQTSMWLSADPAMGEYIPLAPIDDEAKKHNEELPGMGGVFNHVNLHTYHYAGNNPIKLVDPTGREDDLSELNTMLYDAMMFIQRNAKTDEEKAVAAKLETMMNSGKVQFDNVRQRYETPNHKGHSEDTIAFFDSYEYTTTGEARNIIVIDIDKARAGGLPGLIRSLAHEGYHALQFERGEIGVNMSKILDSDIGVYITKLTNIETPAYKMGSTMYNKYAVQNGLKQDRILNWFEVFEMLANKVGL
jgi:RHS repeat-associated protein